jgi:hypothetical protein
MFIAWRKARSWSRPGAETNSGNARARVAIASRSAEQVRHEASAL